jgi:hypothetical protein
MSPPGAITVLFWEFIQPRGDSVYDESLANEPLTKGVTRSALSVTNPAVRSILTPMEPESTAPRLP